jgi:rod shape-determining protein MreB
MNFNFFKNKNVALDLGNNNTVVSNRESVLFSQPSYIVFDGVNGVKAIGDLAYNMFEKNHELLRPVKPLKGGVIADYDSARTMILEMVQQAFGGKGNSFISGYDCIVSGIPFNTTEVERRALRDVLDQFSARRTFMIYEPVAAAMGIGLNIREPNGKMLIDIGGGITEIVVISLSGVAAFQSLKVAGDTFDEEIQDHFRRNYNMAIGLKTAEQIKIKVGAVLNNPPEIPPPLRVKGKDLVEGIPVTRMVTHSEICHVLEKSVSAIEHSVVQTLETCPPELAGDIYGNGLHITGGSAMLRGLRERFEAKLRLAVHIDSQPLLSVSRGIAATLGETKKYQSILME